MRVICPSCQRTLTSSQIQLFQQSGRCHCGQRFSIEIDLSTLPKLPCPQETLPTPQPTGLIMTRQSDGLEMKLTNGYAVRLDQVFLNVQAPAYYLRNRSVRLESQRISQLYTTQIGKKRKTYQITAVLQNGEREVAVRNLTSMEEAFFVEQEIERFLAIEDGHVSDEFGRQLRPLSRKFPSKCPVCEARVGFKAIEPHEQTAVCPNCQALLQLEKQQRQKPLPRLDKSMQTQLSTTLSAGTLTIHARLISKVRFVAILLFLPLLIGGTLYALQTPFASTIFWEASRSTQLLVGLVCLRIGGLHFVFLLFQLFNAIYHFLKPPRLEVDQTKLALYGANCRLTTLDLSQVEQFYVGKEQVETKRRSVERFVLRALMKNGRSADLLFGHRLSLYLAIEHQIESFLGIIDQPVNGEQRLV